MSTIKSSAENLTLNADGANNDIKFQSNGSEVASIDQAGTVTATSFAGSGANLTGVGVDGITSSANATAMTISASENLRVSDSNSNSDKARISTWQSNTQAGTSIGGTNLAVAMQHYGGANSVVQMGMGYIVNHPPAVIGYKVETNSGNTKGDIFFATRDDTADIAPTERMRITVGGKVLVGTTSVSPNSSNSGLMLQNPATDSIRSSVGSHTTNKTHIRFYNGNGAVGGIGTSSSSTAFETSSDYRLKENVDYTWDATTRLKQLKPARFNFIADDTNTLVDGFIAHEAQAVVPECVSGTKDAMRDETDEEGNVTSVPDMQGIDQSKLVPLLVKTIQELEARITALEA